MLSSLLLQVQTLCKSRGAVGRCLWTEAKVRSEHLVSLRTARSSTMLTLSPQFNPLVATALLEAGLRLACVSRHFFGSAQFAHTNSWCDSYFFPSSYVYAIPRAAVSEQLHNGALQSRWNPAHRETDLSRSLADSPVIIRLFSLASWCCFCCSGGRGSSRCFMLPPFFRHQTAHNFAYMLLAHSLTSTPPPPLVRACPQTNIQQLRQQVLKLSLGQFVCLSVSR